MKKIIFSLSLFLTLNTIVVPVAFAVTKSPTPDLSPTNTASASSASAQIDQQINKLKDQIASRVAQLKLVDKRAILGTITEVTGNQLTISDLNGNTRFVQVDELTKFNSPDTKGTFGLSDMTKGTFIGILGLYNKEAKSILARFIDVVSFPKVISGVVTSVNKPNYLLHVATADNKDIPVDIEVFTKTYGYAKDNGLTKAGFSKIKEGERIMVIGFNDKNNKTHILANRILLFPDLPANPKIIIPSPTEASPSGTLTPSITSKPSPTPTKKSTY